MPYELNTQTFSALKGASQTDRLEAFKKTTDSEAKKILLGMRASMVDKHGKSKDGVLRLVHTSHHEKSMKFKRAGEFQRIFMGKKLKRSAEMFIDLLDKAGLPKDQIDALKKAAEKYGTDGFRFNDALRYINKVVPTSGDTPQEALSEFGVSDVTEKNKKLGAGGYGNVIEVRYRGDVCAYKTFQEDVADEKLRIPIVGENNLEGKVIHAKAADSFVSFDAPKSQPPKSAIDPKKINELEDRIKKITEDSMESKKSSENSENYFYRGTEKDQDELLAVKSMAVAVPGQRTEKTEENGMALQAELGKLGRKGIVNVTRIKDVPQVVVPDMILVRETDSNGAQRFHAVPGGQGFKAWSRQQAAGAELHVQGVLMPKAKGKPLGSYDKNDNFKINCKASDLTSVAQSGLEGLKGLAKHGFIHGDIKPLNLFFDAQSKNLQFIDVDGLQKITKKADGKIPVNRSELTRRYAHPLTLAGQPCGVGRDLCAFGVTLLESALTLNNSPEAEDTLERILSELQLSEASGLAMMRARSPATRKELIDKIKLEQDNFKNDGVEHFALHCIITALEYEETRVENGTNHQFERYSADSLNHPLNLVSRHPFVSGTA